MADMYTPQEIQDIFERYNEALRKNVPISESLAKEMADATKGVKNYTQTLNYNIKSLGTSFKTLAQDLNSGARGAAVFNNSIEATGEIVSTIASKFGILGLAISGAVKIFTMFVGAANKQSDALYKSYQDISRAGAAGKEGLTGVYGSMKQFGYTLDQLNDMGALLKENARTLALFSSSALSGTKQFGAVADSIQNSTLRKQFFNLGMTVDDINRGIAGYMVQEGKLGKLRGKDQADVSKGAAAYIREMEILTRLTGQTRQEMEEQRDRAMQMDEFYASMMDIGDNEQKSVFNVLNYLNSLDPKYGVAFAKSMNGIIDGSQEQQELLFATNFQLLDWTQALKEGRMSSDQFKQSVSQAASNNLELAKNQSKVGAGFMGSLRSQALLSGKGLDSFAQSTAEVTSDVDKAAAGFDKATNAQSAMRDSQIKSAQSMQDLVNLGVNPVTRAMAYLAEVVENLTSLLPGSKSKGPGQQGTGTQGGRLAAAGAGAASGAAVGGMMLGPLGAAAGGLFGGLTGAMAYQMHGGAGDSTSGLRIKGGEGGQAMQGGEARPGLYALAQRIQNQLGGDLNYFSAFNDKYHHGLDYTSAHTKGTALDFTLTDPSKAAQVAALVRGMAGVSSVRDEYNNPSPRSSGNHIHAEIAGASGFRGMLSGPMSGYKPNITMHGSEELSIRPSGTGTGSSNASASEGAMIKLIERVDELIYLSKNQLGVNEKILRYQQ